MANLLDTIRQNSAPKPVGMEDDTTKLQSLLRAKSGKAVEGAPVAASSLGEQQANVNTNAQLGQVAGQAAVQNAGLGAQQAAQNSELASQKVDIGQSNRFNTVQNKLQTDKLLQDFAQSGGQIDLAQDKAKVNQLGFNLRMANQQYVDNLNREGARARLNDDLSFKQEMAKKTFGNNEALFKAQLGNKSILDASNNEFQKAMGSMTADQAYEAFHNSVAAEKERALYTGIASVAGAGIGAAATASNSNGGGSTGAPTGVSSPSKGTTVYGGGSMES